MILRILKALTAISFLSITFAGDHIGGPFGLYVILGLFSSFPTSFISGLIILVILSFFYSAIKPSPKRDKILFLAGGVILFIPIISHLKAELEIFYHHKNLYFMISSLPFLILYGVTIFKVWRINIIRM